MGDDQEQLRQHWQELAEQLGLDDPKQPEAISVPKKEETEPAAAIQAETIKQTEMTKPRSIGSAGDENVEIGIEKIAQLRGIYQIEKFRDIVRRW